MISILLILIIRQKISSCTLPYQTQSCQRWATLIAHQTVLAGGFSLHMGHHHANDTFSSTIITLLSLMRMCVQFKHNV